jgi:hypothetical protein
MTMVVCSPAASSAGATEMLKMRIELRFLLRLYLEPILIGRGVEREHAIKLLHLI